MKKKERIKEIKKEIEWYGIRKTIADAMLELGQMGFETSGHGSGCGGEDFSLMKDDTLHVNFCDRGKSCHVTLTELSKCDEETDTVIFEGTVGKSMKKIKTLTT